MSNNTEIEPTTVEPNGTKSKSVKTKETISFLSTAVPLLGVVGTAFVWAAANFYVGTVDIKPSTEYKEISVKVFDQKGAEREFHTPHFLLEPGKYHMAIDVDNKGPHHLDTEVGLGKTSNINVIDSELQTSKTKDANAEHKHWWQFWKKSSADKSDEPDKVDSKPATSNPENKASQ